MVRADKRVQADIYARGCRFIHNGFNRCLITCLSQDRLGSFPVYLGASYCLHTAPPITSHLRSLLLHILALLCFPSLLQINSLPFWRLSPALTPAPGLIGL